MLTFKDELGMLAAIMLGSILILASNFIVGSLLLTPCNGMTFSEIFLSGMMWRLVVYFVFLFLSVFYSYAFSFWLEDKLS